MKTIRYKQATLLLLCLASAMLGQFYFARRPDYPWDAVIFYAVSILLLYLALRRPAARAAAAPQPPILARLTPDALLRALPVAAGLLLGLLAVLNLVDEERASYWPAFWLWLLGGLLYLAGFARRPDLARIAAAARTAAAWSRRASARLATSGVVAGPGAPPTGPVSLASALEWALVAALLALALILRTYHIDTIPWTLGGDEGNFGLWARAVLRGELRNMFVTGHLSMPTMYTFFQAAWLRLAGDDIVGLRLPWAVLGALSVLGCYLLVRRLFGRGQAFLAAALLATYHFHIHYSRLGINNISDPLFLSWALYFLVVGWQSGRRWAWVASGMLGGLAFYSYTGSRLVPVVLISVLAWAALTGRRFLPRHRLDLLAMLGGFMVVFGPMASFALRHPDDFNARINQIGVFQSGWLAAAQQATGQNVLSLMAGQVARAFGAFNFFRDRTDFYSPSIPLMDFGASVFLVLGAALAAGRTLRPERGDEDSPQCVRHAIFVIWFVLAIFIGGALTESPPSSQRLVASTVPAVFFVALALRELTASVRDALAWPEDLRQSVLAGLSLALVVTSLRYYFVTYQQSWTYGSFNAEVATRIGYFLRGMATQPAAGRPLEEYFFGAPRMYADFGTIPFMAPMVRLHDVEQPLAGPPDFVDPAYRSVFVFLPERAGELPWVQQAYPNGSVYEVHRMDDPRAPLLFVAYRAP